MASGNDERIVALHANVTRQLVPLILGKPLVDCQWIYTVKLG